MLKERFIILLNGEAIGIDFRKSFTIEQTVDDPNLVLWFESYDEARNYMISHKINGMIRKVSFKLNLEKLGE